MAVPGPRPGLPARAGAGAPRPAEGPVTSGGLCRHVTHLRRWRRQRGDPQPWPCPHRGPGPVPSRRPALHRAHVGSSSSQGPRCPRKAGDRWEQLAASVLCRTVPAPPGPERGAGGVQPSASSCQAKRGGRAPKQQRPPRHRPRSEVTPAVLPKDPPWPWGRVCQRLSSTAMAVTPAGPARSTAGQLGCRPRFLTEPSGW